MQIVHFRFCHVSKFLAQDCLHYNAVKCTATCNLFTYLVHQNATFQVKNKKTYSANPESKLRPNPIILTTYSLFSKNTFQRTANHHFGWTIWHFFSDDSTDKISVRKSLASPIKLTGFTQGCVPQNSGQIYAGGRHCGGWTCMLAMRNGGL